MISSIKSLIGWIRKRRGEKKLKDITTKDPNIKDKSKYGPPYKVNISKRNTSEENTALNCTNNLIKEIVGYMVQSFPIQSRFNLVKYKNKKINKKSSPGKPGEDS